MTTRHLAFVDTPAAVARAVSEAPQARLITDNPLLAADPALADPIVNLDEAMDQPTVTWLGGRSLDITAEIERRLAAPDIALRFGCVPGHLRLGGVVSRLIATLMYRGTLLARTLARHRPDRLDLFVSAAPRWEPANPILLHLFASSYVALAEHGFCGDVSLRTTRLDVPLPEIINDTAIREWAPRIAMTPLPVLIYESLRRIGMAGMPGGPEVVVADARNDTLRECLPWLAVAGYRPRVVGKLAATDLRAASDAPAEADNRLVEALEPWLTEAIADTQTLDARQSRAVAGLALLHISAGLQLLGRQSTAVGARLDALFPKPGRRRVILSNGLFGPLGAQAYGQCKARGVTVVGFEHGATTGLAASAQAKIDYSEATNCDAVLVSSERAAEAFSAVGRGPALDIAVVGLPDQARRTMRKRWQRRLARRRLGIKGGRSVVMHVSTYPRFGNLYPGGGAPGETVAFNVDRRLITEVYTALDHRVVFKPYPAQRLAYEPPYAQLFDLPPNLTLADDQDFRYIRAAADVLVTATPTSTLGWCVGTGVPLIWLDSELINPLLDAGLRQAFRDSFLVVDLDTSDWTDRLRALLNRDAGEIQADWQTRAEARATFLERCVTGPPGSTGRRGARLVKSLIRKSTRAPTIGAASVASR